MLFYAGEMPLESLILKFFSICAPSEDLGKLFFPDFRFHPYEAGSLTPSEAYAEEITALVKEAKIAEIRAAFTTAEANGYVESSLGFRIDATRRSIEDIDGLIDLVSSGALPAPVTFRDYDNAYHSLTLDQLNILRLEAKGRGPVLYARKWELEAAVEAAETMEAVQAVDAGAGWPGV